MADWTVLGCGRKKEAPQIIEDDNRCTSFISAHGFFAASWADQPPATAYPESLTLECNVTDCNFFVKGSRCRAIYNPVGIVVLDMESGEKSEIKLGKM
jgi:hypothetical protein